MFSTDIGSIRARAHTLQTIITCIGIWRTISSCYTFVCYQVCIKSSVGWWWERAFLYTFVKGCVQKNWTSCNTWHCCIIFVAWWTSSCTLCCCRVSALGVQILRIGWTLWNTGHHCWISVCFVCRVVSTSWLASSTICYISIQVRGQALGDTKPCWWCTRISKEPWRIGNSIRTDINADSSNSICKCRVRTWRNTQSGGIIPIKELTIWWVTVTNTLTKISEIVSPSFRWTFSNGICNTNSCYLISPSSILAHQHTSSIYLTLSKPSWRALSYA